MAGQTGLQELKDCIQDIINTGEEAKQELDKAEDEFTAAYQEYKTTTEKINELQTELKEVVDGIKKANDDRKLKQESYDDARKRELQLFSTLQEKSSRTSISKLSKKLELATALVTTKKEEFMQADKEFTKAYDKGEKVRKKIDDKMEALKEAHTKMVAANKKRKAAQKKKYDGIEKKSQQLPKMYTAIIAPKQEASSLPQDPSPQKSSELDMFAAFNEKKPAFQQISSLPERKLLKIKSMTKEDKKCKVVLSSDNKTVYYILLPKERGEKLGVQQLDVINKGGYALIYEGVENHTKEHSFRIEPVNQLEEQDHAPADK